MDVRPFQLSLLALLVACDASPRRHAAQVRAPGPPAAVREMTVPPPPFSPECGPLRGSSIRLADVTTPLQLVAPVKKAAHGPLLPTKQLRTVHVTVHDGKAHHQKSVRLLDEAHRLKSDGLCLLEAILPELPFHLAQAIRAYIATPYFDRPKIASALTQTLAEADEASPSPNLALMRAALLIDSTPSDAGKGIALLSRVRAEAPHDSAAQYWANYLLAGPGHPPFLERAAFQHDLNALDPRNEPMRFYPPYPLAFSAYNFNLADQVSASILAEPLSWASADAVWTLGLFFAFRNELARAAFAFKLAAQLDPQFRTKALLQVGAIHAHQQQWQAAFDATYEAAAQNDLAAVISFEAFASRLAVSAARVGPDATEKLFALPQSIAPYVCDALAKEAARVVNLELAERAWRSVPESNQHFAIGASQNLIRLIMRKDRHGGAEAIRQHDAKFAPGGAWQSWWDGQPPSSAKGAAYDDLRDGHAFPAVGKETEDRIRVTVAACESTLRQLSRFRGRVTIEVFADGATSVRTDKPIDASLKECFEREAQYVFRFAGEGVSADLSVTVPHRL